MDVRFLSVAVLFIGMKWVSAQAPASPPPPSGPDWRTSDHSPGRCAMYGTCGHRRDGDPLACAANVAAAPPSDTLAARLQAVCPSLWAEYGGTAGKYCCTADQVDRLSADTQKALPFIVGCPACRHNFVQLWCLLFCSPDQATFANITEVQLANDTGASNAVAEVDYWLSEEYGNQLYDSCKDVKFGPANMPAMSFIGGGASNGQQWLDFLGTLKDKRLPPLGSPIQINFRPENSTPAGQRHMRERVVACADNAFRCSCSDCPQAQGCAQPAPAPPPSSASCQVGRLSCLAFTLVCVYGIYVAIVVVMMGRFGGNCGDISRGWRGWWRRLGAGGGVTTSATAENAAVHGDGADGGVKTVRHGDCFDVLSEPLLRGLVDGGGGGGSGGSGGEGGGGSGLSRPVSRGTPPPVERLLQRWYFGLGLWVGRQPGRVVVAGAVLVAVCCLGLVRFHVETDPQRLWVGPSSQAAREKAAYESSFGAFYRVEQMIVATRPTLGAAGGDGGHLPPIVTADNMRLMFDLQKLVDEMEAPLEIPGAPARSVRLTDICYKPFGDVCATQSVLQYWRLNRTLYETEQARPVVSPGRMTPEYCFNRWFTQCRSAFQAPIDPHVVLGGFPRGINFTNYSAGSTAFVTTYPISSDSALRPAALAWEAAFVRLAVDRLAPAAEAANLTLSFSTERSVQDELSRESSADAGTVAASYGIMLLYIAMALGSFPSPLAVWRVAQDRGLGAAWQLLRGAALTSRMSLGFAGVSIVAGSVAGALGLVSAAGLWCTLIIMEVIPFLVLAVGVDNMFVLAAAMAKQPHSLPPPERLALALSSAGPSITLAAACEVAAFAMGGLLTSMPAVRNFSLAAAVAVALDFALQVTVFAALLVLDVWRLQARRLDCAPCVRLGRAFGDGEGKSGMAVRRPEVAAQEGSDPYVPPMAGGADMTAYDSNDANKERLFENDEVQYISLSNEGEPDEQSYWSLQRVLQAYFERIHAPLLSRPMAQVTVLLLFGATLAAGLVALPALQVGLDQAVALPRDSYLQPFFSDLMRNLRVGPPLLLVVRDLHLHPESHQVERLCGVSGCDQDSLINRVSAAARDPGRTFISAPAASWLDDFISWLSPDLTACCRSRPEEDGPEGYCPPPDQPPCAVNTSACTSCRTCVQVAFEGGRPSVSQFQTYLPWFLAARPSEQCAKGGLGAYSDSLQRVDSEDPTSVAGLLPERQQQRLPQRTTVQPGAALPHWRRQQSQIHLPWQGRVRQQQQQQQQKQATGQEELRGEGTMQRQEGGNRARHFGVAVGQGGNSEGVQTRANGAGSNLEFGSGGRVAASSFRTYYPPLNQQTDFIEALRQSRAFAARASEELNLDVFAYSLFHVFFEQYLSVLYDATAMIGLPLLLVLGVAWTLSGSLWSASLLAGVLASVLVHLGGCMWLAGIQVNAVSLVNLAMALGIAVEFCAHILHAFMVASPLPPSHQPSDGTAAPAAAASRAARSRAALVSVGASVLSGVTLTKLVGVVVLAFARTQIFEVYYFRLYLALVVVGAAHGLVLLPVLLSLMGPPSWRGSAGVT